MARSSPDAWAPPASVADLRLPPTFVVEHVIRTLSYQGTLTPAEVARSLRVQDGIALELLDGLRSAGLVQLDAGQANFDRLGRLRLTDAGNARVAVARQRTWYAGPLPVSFSDFSHRTGAATRPECSSDAFRSELQPLAFEANATDAIGQAIAAGATVVIDGVAADEQRELASALGRGLAGTVTLPYALFAAGAVIRLFDPQRHRPVEERPHDDDALDVFRSSRDVTQWATVARPSITLTGGVLPSDVVPAYDEDARFYVAPPPLAAIGGLLCVIDAGMSLQTLVDLAQLWLTPGTHGVGVLMLRSGERIELPWRTATALIGVAPASLPEPVRRAVGYDVDVGRVEGHLLSLFLAHRLLEPAFPESVIEHVASRLEKRALCTRAGASAACRYLRDRADYERDAFSPSPSVLDQAVEFAAMAPARRGSLRAA